MKTSDVTTVINTICEKLGIVCKTASDFVPALAKYKIAMAIFGIGVSVLFIVLSLIAIKVAYSYAKKHYVDIENSGAFDATLAIGMLTIAICVAFVVYNLYNLIGWVAVPNAKAVLYVVDLIGN